MTKKKKYWSREVTMKSFALDLEPGVFTFDDPKKSRYRSNALQLRAFAEKVRRFNPQCPCLIST